MTKEKFQEGLQEFSRWADPWESNLIPRMALAMAPAAVTEEYVEMGEGA